MNGTRTALLMLWLSACACAPGAACAADAASAAQHPALTMAQAVKMAEARYHASVAKAETQKDGARTVYVLRLYNKASGKVWTVRVDAASGDVL
jgi:uncharacterized membrane protein YkoI